MSSLFSSKQGYHIIWSKVLPILWSSHIMVIRSIKGLWTHILFMNYTVILNFIKYVFTVGQMSPFPFIIVWKNTFGQMTCWTDDVLGKWRLGKWRLCKWRLEKCRSAGSRNMIRDALSIKHKMGQMFGFRHSTVDRWKTFTTTPIFW